MRMMRKRLEFAFMLVAILLLIGTAYYRISEGWSFVDSFYFSTMTLTTIGFGDLVPTNDGSKIFTSFYALFGIGIMLYILSSVMGMLIFKQERRFSKAFNFFHPMRNHDKPFKNHEQEHRIDKLVRQVKPSIEKQGKEIKKLKKQVEPSLAKQEREIKTLKKRIKSKS